MSALRVPGRKHPLVSAADMFVSPAPGTPVLVTVVLDRNSGPHQGVLIGRVPSGRLSVRVERMGRVWRLLTEPSNVYPLSTPEGAFQ